ncbi:MAG: ThuA domain-containing protein [Candidatus Diapherotrites archaeon]|nr:ThuA domain-containing protein [Candidatus Diapherotrites archaeon]
MRWLLLLLLLPLSLAKTAIYAKDFSLECYIYRSETAELIPESPYVLAAFLRDSGLDVEVINSSENLDLYDAVVVLPCTTMDPQDVERFVAFYEAGGGLIVDLRDYNPVAEQFGVVKKTYEMEGLERGSLSTTYVTITNGILVNNPLISPSGPLRYGYERMYYVGEPIFLPKGFNSGFVTENGENVLGWKVENGRLVVTGCLYCSGPLLLVNLVDWAEDGVVDFPDFTVVRDVIPSTVLEGETLADMVRIVADEDLRIEGEYVYGVSGPFCDFGEPTVEFKGPTRVGDRVEMEALFTYTAEGTGSCLLPPVLLTLSYENQKREVIVDPVEVTVSQRRIALYNESFPYLAAVGVLLLAVAFVALRPFLRRRYLLREREKYQQLIKLTMKRRMQGELSEEAYKQLVSEYQKKLQEIEFELSLLSGGKGSKQRQGQRGRQPPWRR